MKHWLGLGIILLGAITVLAVIRPWDRGDAEQVDAEEMLAIPEVASFMASEFFPEEVKQRYLKAMIDGGLHPQRLDEATDSWRAISENRATGTVISVSSNELVLSRLADGEEWRIGINSRTSASRGGQPIPASELRRGEFVEALSQDGVTADIVVNFSQPLPR